MRYKSFPNIVDLVDRWCEITGDDQKEVRQRTRELRRANMLPDFRESEAHLTDEHLATFLISMLASDRHNQAPEAARQRGSLQPSKISSQKNLSHPWKTTGSLLSDVAAVLQEMRNTEVLIVGSLTIATTHKQASMTLVYRPPGTEPLPVYVEYGEVLMSGVGPMFPVITTRKVEAQVIWHLKGLVT